MVTIMLSGRQMSVATALPRFSADAPTLRGNHSDCNLLLLPIQSDVL